MKVPFPTPKADRCEALANQCTGRDCGEGVASQDRLHRGLSHSMTGSYGNALMEFAVIHWAEDAVPEIEFVGDGSWPSLNLEQVDELIADFDRHLQSLRAAREHMALLTDPSVHRPSAS